VCCSSKQQRSAADVGCCWYSVQSAFMCCLRTAFVTAYVVTPLLHVAGILRGQVMLQALPCIVAAQVLDPAPGSRVLDMCAAPGGESCYGAMQCGAATS
jgi:16S rRNA C967 or C1407 C5-methylase (RsmB/RsmF family)